MRFHGLLLTALLGVAYTSPLHTHAAPADSAREQDILARSFSRGAPLPQWAQALAEIPATQREDPLVVRLAETQSYAGATQATLINRAVQVNDRNMLDRIGQLSLTYYPDYQKLKLHRLTILRDDKQLDHTRTVNARLLQREQALEQGMYTGASTVQLLVEDVRLGDTLWLTYSIEGSNPVFGNRLTEDYSWDNADPVELRRLTVFYPAQRPVRWQQFGDFRTDAISPKVDDYNGMKRLRFEARGLEALEYEGGIPAEYFPARFLQFSEYRDWNEVARWATGLFPEPKTTPALAALVKQFNAEATPAARAAAALRWVQNEVRYFSVSIGENSHKPQDPNVVIKRRYGDCKDKTYLLVTLLRAMGITAHPLLVSAQAPRLPGRMMASPTLFDHVIVQLQVDRKTYHVDPTRTGQPSPLDKLSLPLPGAKGLLVAADTTALSTLPERDNNAIRFERDERIVIQRFDGDATLETNETFSDSHAESARLNFPSMSRTEFKRDLLAIYEKQYPGITLAADPEYRDDVANNRFYLKARFKLPKPLQQKEGRYRIEYDSSIISGSLGIPDKIVRNYPLQLARGAFTARYRLRLQWPDSVRLNKDPQNTTLDTPYFRAAEEYSVRGNSMDYLLDYQVKVDSVAAKEVPELQHQAKQLSNYTSGNFNVDGHFAKQPRDGKLSMRALDGESTSQDARQIVDLAAKIRPSSEEDIATLCHALLTVNQLKDSKAVRSQVQAVESLVRQFRKSVAAQRCQARALLEDARFAESVAAHEKAGALDDDDSDMPDLAWARYYAGDTDKALQDMARYSQAMREENGALPGFVAVNQLALLKLAGRDIPADALQYARQLPNGPWPRPLLGMQAGLITPETLLAQLQSLPADERDLALSEAWYYIGLQRLAEQKPEEARKAFQWVADNGIPSYEETVQARIQLRRLGQ